MPLLLNNLKNLLDRGQFYLERKTMMLSVLLLYELFVVGHNELIEQQDMFLNSKRSCIISSTEYTSQAVKEKLDILMNISLAQESKEGRVIFFLTELQSFTWPNGGKISFINSRQKNIPLSSNIEVFIIPKQKVDRTCLLKPNINIYPNAFVPSLSSLDSVDSLLDVINTECNLYRQSNGFLSPQGLHRQEILRSLFRVNSVSDVSMKKLTPPKIESKKGSVSHDSSFRSKNCRIKDSTKIQGTCVSHDITDNKYSSDMAKCEEIDYIPSEEEFFHHYLKLSKPLIIRKAVESWPAFQKWSNKFLREQYASSVVHIKLTPGGEFEGVEAAELWEDYKHFNIPDEVKKQLEFPDLVVVRPAVLNINFTDFMDIVESVANGSRKNISAYLEYSSIRQYLPELEADISEFQFISDLLKREHLNVWLSDGNTLGKLHFDPFDNLLCQISGTKEVILFEPYNNSQLYEAHIPEALLSYNRERNQFRRKTLLDSTSMVMSPVDIKKPDYKRFPLFADAHPMNCTIEEGDVLFMPSYWWHEVQSYPNKSAGRNLAVNYWYEPFLKKDVPCAECSLDINPIYRHLL